MRKSLLAGVAMVASLAVFSDAADAKMQQISRTGAWISYAGINNGGYPQCVTSTVGQFDNSIASVQFKYDSNHPTTLLVHLAKTSWVVPKGTNLRVEFQVDNVPSRVYDAEGISGNLVQIAVELNETDSVTGEPAIQLLMNLLKSGVMLNVSFPDGNETPWRASLNGSAAELGQLSNCVGLVIAALKNKNNPTQPFSSGGGGSTQPFSGGNSSQPFGSNGKTKLLHQ